jgi:hypothetical protein
MKRSSNSVSPFIILLLPALLVIGLKSTANTGLDQDKEEACVELRMPSVKAATAALIRLF